MSLNVDERMALITRNTVEVIGEDVLLDLLKKGKKPVVYCGYETSGDIHLGHLVSMTKLLDLSKAGCTVNVLFADWHTYLNQKGDWDFIHQQIDLWRKGFVASGLSKVAFVLGSEVQRKIPYIDDVFTLARETTLNRGLRSMQTVARDIEHAKVSQVIYPLMQIADFKHLKAHGALGGIEQRKIHMLALERLKDISYGPCFVIHHELIPSLKGPDSGKMSSSDASSMITLRDSDSDIRKKLKKAHCPEGDVRDNPVLAIVKLVLFPRFSTLEVKRDAKFGGNVTFNDYASLEKAFGAKTLHPVDLKTLCGDYLVKVIGDIRKKIL